MSYAGFASVAAGIAALDTTNQEAQLTKALSVINNVETIFELQLNQTEIQQTDAQNVYRETMDPQNINNPVPAAAAQELKTLHSSQADAQMGIMTAIVGSQKGESELLGQNMGQSYLLMKPIEELLKTVTHSLTRY